MPLPDTVAVPTVVPPVTHVTGAVDCGPKTLNVIVPVAPLVAPESAEEIELLAIAVLVASVAGAAAVSAGPEMLTTVELIVAPQALFDAALLESPP